MATKKTKRETVDFEKDSLEDQITWKGKKYHSSHWNSIKDIENAGADARKNWNHLAQYLKNDGFTPAQVFDLALESKSFDLPKRKNLRVLRIVLGGVHKRKREKKPVSINGIITENLEEINKVYGNYISDDATVRAVTEVFRRYRKRPFREKIWINAIIFSEDFK